MLGYSLTKLRLRPMSASVEAHKATRLLVAIGGRERQLE
jgi:hypothetical protein